MGTADGFVSEKKNQIVDDSWFLKIFLQKIEKKELFYSSTFSYALEEILQPNCSKMSSTFNLELKLNF